MATMHMIAGHSNKILKVQFNTEFNTESLLCVPSKCLVESPAFVSASVYGKNVNEQVLVCMPSGLYAATL